MGKFRPVPQQVEAVQWKKAGDHPDVAAMTSPTVHEDCGEAYAAHGFHHPLNQIVCPGDWLVTDHGAVAIWHDGDFRAAFEPLKEW